MAIYYQSLNNFNHQKLLHKAFPFKLLNSFPEFSFSKCIYVLILVSILYPSMLCSGCCMPYLTRNHWWILKVFGDIRGSCDQCSCKSDRLWWYLGNQICAYHSVFAMHLVTCCDVTLLSSLFERDFEYLNCPFFVDESRRTVSFAVVVSSSFIHCVRISTSFPIVRCVIMTGYTPNGCIDLYVLHFPWRSFFGFSFGIVTEKVVLNSSWIFTINSGFVHILSLAANFVLLWLIYCCLESTEMQGRSQGQR